ncbi:MAG: sulfotransferase family protein [Alphaproteobacteria bacterium]|nr:MAG: sulfotransferase family protein [Alphaproteobacteria bacterium]
MLHPSAEIARLLLQIVLGRYFTTFKRDFMVSNKGPKAKGGTKPFLPGLGGARLQEQFKGMQTGPVSKPDHMDLFKIQSQLEKAMDYHRRGQLEVAASIYQDILVQKPDQPDAMNLLGVVNLARGNKHLGIEQISSAVRLRPKDPTILNNLGNALLGERRWEEAIEALEHAIALKPDFVEALNNLARAYRSSDRSEDSEYCYEQVLKLKPDAASAKVGLARLYHDRGQSEMAENLLKEALSQKVNKAGALTLFAQTRKFKEEPAEMAEMLEIVGQSRRPAPEITNLYYALGKICDDLGRYDDAFGYYAKGNELRGLEHDPEDFVKEVDILIETFDKKFFEERKDFGTDSHRPIFIVGMPRSGTTLREQIISSHSKVFGAGELEHVKRLQMQSMGMAPGNMMWPKNVPNLTKEGATILGRRYLRSLERHSSTHEYVTDKMPHNFLSLGLMAVMFKNAKFIHAKRNAIDTSLSCYFHNFNDAHSYNRNLTHMGLYYRQYVRMMNHWHEVLGDRLYFSDYEELVNNQEEETRKLIDFCGLEWEDACMQFHKSKRAVLTPSNWQVRQPMYKRSAERWRRYEDHLGPLIEALGDIAPV